MLKEQAIRNTYNISLNMGVKKSSTNLPGLLALPCATIIICHKGPGDCRLRSPNCQPEPFRGRVHTHTRGGRVEGGNKDSQPQPTTGKQKEENRQGSTPHAGRTKEGKREGGRKSTQEPNPGTQKSKQRKAQQATKQKHSSEKIEAGQHREGTNTIVRSGKKGVGWVGKEGRKRRRTGQDKKGGRCPRLCKPHH